MNAPTIKQDLMVDPRGECCGQPRVLVRKRGTARPPFYACAVFVSEHAGEFEAVTP